MASKRKGFMVRPKAATEVTLWQVWEITGAIEMGRGSGNYETIGFTLLCEAGMFLTAYRKLGIPNSLDWEQAVKNGMGRECLYEGADHFLAQTMVEPTTCAA